MRGVAEECKSLAGMDPRVNAVADTEAPSEDGWAEGQEFSDSIAIRWALFYRNNK